MRKEHEQKIFESSSDVPVDPNRYKITRDDLEGDEIRIYDRFLAKLDHPSADQLRMLATYAWLAVKFKEAADNKLLALYIHDCMIYARNRLGLWKPIPIDALTLLLDDVLPDHQNWPYYPLYLDSSWEIQS